ncbi:efflux RND transporter periplasmic adaptor subunit [Pseudidiomarina insulisalsae]|uniref:Efflux transporter periplasmic adaptor subunit n=1 Tax=Pseudidiomarina insulisalsae TaxID=575789 RepID=A0A432YH77_9GAMM|nr:efflux RND transporter periplasmic adaptor subunit [Pseudidiomarina insulisalsae]RUO60312.1 efflux transporter periplasmic adaptor subunit [Pseudidiomarina insulisalsae]
MKWSFGSSAALLAVSFIVPSLVLSDAVVAQQWGNREQAALVVTQQLGFERKQEQVEAVAYAEALQSVDIYPAVGDVVTAVNFAPGDEVNTGDILVQLDDRRQQIALQRAKLQLADAERTVERLQKSRAQGAIPQSQLDEAIIARDLLEVAVAEAQTEVDDRQVDAPFSGVVGITDVEVGDRITPQTLITTLDKREQLFLDFQAPEQSAAMLNEGAELKVYSWLRAEESLAAEVAEVGSRIDPQNRTIRIRAKIDNSEDRYRPGMSFRVALTLSGDSYPVVPEAGLMWGPEGAYVWIVEDNKAKRVDVSIKQRLPGRVLVDGNLQLGDELIVEGVQTLRRGQAIERLGQDGGAI